MFIGHEHDDPTSPSARDVEASLHADAEWPDCERWLQSIASGDVADAAERGCTAHSGRAAACSGRSATYASGIFSFYCLYPNLSQLT